MKYRPILFCLLTTAILLMGCGRLVSIKLPADTNLSEDENWLMLGGNPQHQHYSHRNINPPFDIVWKKRVKSVVADHPLAIGDVIMAPTRSGIMYLVNYETGEGMGNGKIGPAIEHTPTIYQKNIYAGLNLGHKTLVGFNLRDAHRILNEKYPPITTSPLVDGQRLFFGTNKSLFFCANRESGAEIWRYQTHAPVRSSPTLLSETVFFGDDKGWVYALDTSSGIEIWKQQLEGSTFSHPVADDSIIYIGTVSGRMYALDGRSGKILWNRKFDGAIYSSPALYKNVLYFGNNTHEVIALHKKTGETIWIFKTNGVVNTVPLPSPDYLYVGSWDKSLYVLNRFSGKLVYKYQLRRPIKSSPIIYRDFLILQTANDKLIALANEKVVQARRKKK